MTTRDRTVVVVVLALAAIVGSWLLVIEPKRQQASQLGDQVSAAQTKLDAARVSVAQGEAARSAFAKNYTAVAQLGEAVPPDDNVPSLIYQLQSAANGARVDFRSLLLQPGASASTPAASSASAAQAVTATLPPGATVGPAGFPTEPFTFTFRGDFFQLADFFGRLERFVVANNRRVSVSGRLMTLNALSFLPAPQGFPQITASISATTYLVPAAQGLLNGATPGGPAGASPPRTVSGPGTSAPPVTALATPPVR